jgi:hypothetical protein
MDMNEAVRNLGGVDAAYEMIVGQMELDVCDGGINTEVGVFALAGLSHYAVLCDAPRVYVVHGRTVAKGNYMPRVYDTIAETDCPDAAEAFATAAVGSGVWRSVSIKQIPEALVR